MAENNSGGDFDGRVAQMRRNREGISLVKGQDLGRLSEEEKHNYLEGKFGRIFPNQVEELSTTNSLGSRYGKKIDEIEQDGNYTVEGAAKEEVAVLDDGRKVLRSEDPQAVIYGDQGVKLLRK